MASKTLLAAVPLLSMAFAQLDKPVISPEFPDGGLGSLDQGLLDNIATAGNSWSVWNNGYIPKDCKTLVEGAGFSALDVSTIEITYSDCADSWILCRHNESPISEQSIVDVFGRMPSYFRSFVRHMLFVPGTESAGSQGDNVQMNGDLGISVYIHELAHSLDGHGWEDIGQMSASQVWLDAYNADSAVTDGYAQSSQAENFAQMTVVALYDNVVPEGVVGVQPNAQAIQNQYGLVQEYGVDILSPSSTCVARLVNSEPVAQSSSARLRPAGVKPDVSLSKGMRIIKPTPMGKEMHLHEYSNGKVIGERTVQLNA